MYVAMTPISSMCPASMMVGAPAGFTVAMLLPATSPRTSAKAAASSRQTRAGADSNPDGPGVSSRRLRKAIEESLNMTVRWSGLSPARGLAAGDSEQRAGGKRARQLAGRTGGREVMPMTQTLIFLVIGLAAGVLSGLFGIGGGIVIVPMLILL